MSQESCVFCRIAAGVEPAQVVMRTTETVAFLDTRPVFKGHTLVVPRRHVVTLPELPGELLAPYFADVQRVSAVMPRALAAEGTFVALNNVVSQSVAHLHVHVVPRTKGDGLRGFFWPRTRYTGAAEREEYARRLRLSLAD